MWTLPDYGEGDNNLQSILFQEYLDVLVAGIQGIDCVLSGLAVTGGADMTPAVAKGSVLTNSILKAVAAADVTIGTADATNPRIDLIVVNSSGALAVRAGTAAANPKPPARTANDVVIAAVYVPANDTAIATSQCIDMRVLISRGPIVIQRVYTAVTYNTTSAIQTYLTTTVPDGLLLAGRALRIRCGGTYLSNSGTPTWTLTLAYGGTTMFADATAATAADTDRGAWELDLILNASGNATQTLNGRVAFQTPGVKVAPVTGVGDINVTTSVTAPIRGSASVDSDAANRDFTVQWTMNVSNVAVETTMDWAVVEIL